jgi:hypothetical protein
MISEYRRAHMVGRTALLAILAALSVSGCAETRRALGYDKAPPDEFVVVSRAPLSQPPDFTLRPPTPGAPRPQEGTVRDQARSALVGNGAAATGQGAAFADRSQGEQFLLTKAGADHVEPDIRRKVNEETTSLIDADQSFTDTILFWREKPPPGEPIDAIRESKRLQENASLGKPASEGATPQITRRQKAWFEDIF